MTALSVHLVCLRLAAAVMDPEQLVALLGRLHHCVVDVARTERGELGPAGSEDLLVVWHDEGSAAGTVPAATRAIAELNARIDGLRFDLFRSHGLELQPRAGIASGPSGAVERARLLQRANFYYGTAVLLDGHARDQAGQVALREIDRLTPDGEGFLFSPQALAATGIPPLGVAATPGLPTTIYEHLGSRDEVSPRGRSFLTAFHGALELCRSREWHRARVVLEMLTRSPNCDPLVQIYLNHCREQLSTPQMAESMRNS